MNGHLTRLLASLLLALSSPEANAGTARSSLDGLGYPTHSAVLEEVQDGLAVSSAYAGVGRRTALTYGSGRRLDFAHDENHRLKSISDGTPLAAWDWIGPGMRPLQRTTRPSSGAAVSQRFFDPTSHVDTGWDAAQRLIRMTYRDAGGQVIADLGYAYDRAGNRTQETRHEESRRDAYTYDSAYRIASASYGLPTGGGASASPLAVLAEAFSFDLVGNRVALAQDLPDVAQPTRTIDYATNAVNQCTNVSGTAQVHDAAGNLTSDGRFAYAYDFRNLVVEMREIATAKVVRYRYDALGRRIEKRFTEAFAAADGSEGEHEEASVLADDPVGQERVRRFVHDGAQTIEERRGDGSLIREWVYGVGIDEPLEMVRHAGGIAESFNYVSNAIGSVVALTDAAGAVVERYRYEAFGREVVLAADGVTTRTASVVGNPIRFQGRWRDLQEGSPLVYFRARMYDPGTGRFLQRDPAGYVDGPNLYLFVRCNPLRWDDPLGLVPPDDYEVWYDRALHYGDMYAHGMRQGATLLNYHLFGGKYPGAKQEDRDRVVNELRQTGQGAEVADSIARVTSNVVTSTLAAGAASATSLGTGGVAPVAPAAVGSVGAARRADPSLRSESLDSAADAVGAVFNSLTSNDPRPLSFGPSDLVYGPSARGALRELQQSAGGVLLSDLPKPMGTSWIEFSIERMKAARDSGSLIRFDLTHVQEIEELLNGTGKFANEVTSQEIRFLRDNWPCFEKAVKFYRNGYEAVAPWSK